MRNEDIFFVLSKNMSLENRLFVYMTKYLILRIEIKTKKKSICQIIRQ